MRDLLAAALLAAVLPSAVAAHDYTVGDLQIIHPRMIETPPNARAGAGYVAVGNDGETADRLIAVKVDFGHASLHVSETGANGVVKMLEAADGFEIAPGDVLSLEPGAAHIMFMGMEHGFEAGAMVPVTLVFEHAGEVPVEFMVEPRGGGAMEHDHGHDDMDHGS